MLPEPDRGFRVVFDYRFLTIFLAGALLYGCVPVTDDPQIDSRAEVVANHARDLEQSMRTGVRIVDRPWYGSPVPSPDRHSRIPFPPLLSKPDALELRSLEPASLDDVAVALNGATDIPVMVRTDYRAVGEGSNQAVKVLVADRYPMDYQGGLSYVLDRIAARYDIFWDFDGTTITLEPMQTKRWSLPIPVGSTEFRQSSDGLGGGTTTVATSTSHTLDPWSSLENLLQAELAPPASVRVYRDIGQLVVLGRPSDLARIEETIGEQLHIYSNRIGLEVAVYYVDTNELDQFNLQLTALLRRDSGQPSVSTVGTAVPAAGNVRVFGNQTVPDSQSVATANNALTLARAAEENAQRLVSNPALRGDDLSEAEALAALTTAKANTTVAENTLAQARTANLQGSAPASFIDFQALANNGAVVDYRQGSSVTLSGVATPIVISRIRNYVASQSRDEEGRITMETDTIDEGVSIHAIPRLVGPRQIQLSLTVLQNSLIALDNFSTPGATVQLPTTDHRAISSDTLLRPGETLILSGYEQERVSTSRSRGFIGFGREGSSGKVRMVVLVRPALMALSEIGVWHGS